MSRTFEQSLSGGDHAGDGSGNGDGNGRSAREPRVGSRIGPYRLVRLLGTGATGRVFEVEHEKIGRRAAMKTLSAEHAASRGAVQRLFKEAMAVNRINHPHIVEITDLVEDGEHRPPSTDAGGPAPRVNALVMELLEGRSLGQALAAVEPMPPERFLPILTQVCRALTAAHEAGFVHRDLKPENIFLIERTGQPDFVKLLDFGLAKMVDGDPGSQSSSLGLSTQEGTFVGTPGYVSPEQATGKAVDQRTDIYALGIILYEIVVGRLPFEGLSVGDYLVKHVTEAPPALPEPVLATPLGRALGGIIERCLAKNPEARFASAAELGDLFEELGRGKDIHLPPVTRRSRTIPPARAPWRRTALRVGVGVGALLSIGVGTLIVRLRKPAAPQRPSASASASPSASASAPPPPPAAAPSREVTVSFESDPPGAAVFLDGDGDGAGADAAPLGVTPFARTFPRSDAPIRIELRLPGHEPLRLSTPADADRVISARLTRVGPPPAPARKPKDGTKDGRHEPDKARQLDQEGRPVEPDPVVPPLERETTINPFR